VEAFLKVSRYEFFWLDTVNNLYLERQLNSVFELINLPVELEKLIDFGCFFSHIIDFRSPFTATHSSGVAVIAEKLAELSGFAEQECKLMRVAGYLHDIGKLAVPLTILNKPGKLNREEWAVMKSHVYYTYQVLGEIDGFQKAREWSAYHHEHLDGRGYPFHLTAPDLSRGARLMAVADVFTAITEDRPYRKRMEQSRVAKILLKMGEEQKLDNSLVELLLNNYQLMDEVRLSTQNETSKYFSNFKRNTLDF
jgi:HD-GYP domain-containing protein (c-di-GMP phosphodiesterase class II)